MRPNFSSDVTEMPVKPGWACQSDTVICSPHL